MSNDSYFKSIVEVLQKSTLELQRENLFLVDELERVKYDRDLLRDKIEEIQKIIGDNNA